MMGMILRAALLSWLSFVTNTTGADDEIKCNIGGNQLELNACTGDEFAKADKELNQTYQALIQKEAANPIFISKLKLAQKAWLVFRDADLEARFACAEQNVRICWDSIYPMSFLYHKALLTRERTQHLKQVLNDER